MNYKHKYLTYKHKYLNLQNIIYHTKLLSGGGTILQWYPMKSNQLYIQAVVDPHSHLGEEINTRLTKQRLSAFLN